MADVRVGQWSGIENRRHKRVPLKVAIECRSGQAVMEARAENISISGLLVRSASPFPQDTEVIVSFVLPDSARRIQSQARVAHVVPGVFMGLELLRVEPDVLAEIERFVAAAAPVGKPV